MKKKVNPRRRPATQADVRKAKKEAQTLAIDACWAILFSVMRDKEGYGAKRLRRLWDEVNYLSESVSSGHVNIRDLAETLRDESGITLEGLLT